MAITIAHIIGFSLKKIKKAIILSHSNYFNAFNNKMLLSLVAMNF